MVVDDNRSLLSVDHKIDHIYAGIVNFFRHKHSSDTFRIFSKRTKYSQEVAVTKCALFDIIRFDTIAEHINGVVNLMGAFPLIFIVLFLIHFVNSAIVKGRYFRRKLVISPLLTYSNFFLDKLLKLANLISGTL